MTMFHPSKEQIDISSFLSTASTIPKRVTVVAPSGTGKTSTIKYLLNEYPYEKSLYLVFSSDMRKDTENSIKNSSNLFPNISKNNNIDIFTLHGALRKILNNYFPDMKFDYINGLLTNNHLEVLLNKNNIYNNNSPEFLEYFNNVLNKFTKTTEDIDNFFNNYQYDSKILNNKTYKALSSKYDNSPINNIFKKLASDIFLDNIFNKSQFGLPHSIYYKYAHLELSNIDIFSEYQKIYTDESQDLDPIIKSFLNNTKADVLLFGDNDQQIFKWRGSVNMMDDSNFKKFALTRSYRLPALTAIISQALLQNFKTDEKKINNIYGFNKKIKKSEFKNITENDYIDIIIKKIKNIRIDDNQTLLLHKKNKKEFEQSFKKGKKTIIKKAFVEFNKDKNYNKLYKFIKENTEYFKDEIGTKEIKDEINKIRQFYFFSLNEKIKREIVKEEGSNAYLSRNNKNSIEFLLSLLKKIPNNKLSNTTLFNINFSFSKEEKLNCINKHNIENTNIINNSIKNNFIHGLSFLKTRDNGDFFEIYNKFIKINIPAQIKEYIKNNANNADIIEKKLLSLPFLKVSEKKYSLKDLGIDINYFNNLLKTLKQKNTKDKNDTSFVELIHNIGDIIPLGKMINHLCNDSDIKENPSKWVIELSQYSKIKELSENNPNITLTDKNANIHISSIHGSKGLEFDNVFVSKDALNIIEDKNEDISEEVSLGYVAITRSKGNVYIEKNNPFADIIDNICNNGFERYYKNNFLILKEKLLSNKNVEFEYTFLNKYNEIEKIEELYIDDIIPVFNDIKITQNVEGQIISIKVKDKLIYGEDNLENCNNSYLTPSVKNENEQVLNNLCKKRDNFMDINEKEAMEIF